MKDRWRRTPDRTRGRQVARVLATPENPVNQEHGWTVALVDELDRARPCVDRDARDCSRRAGGLAASRRRTVRRRSSNGPGGTGHTADRRSCTMPTPGRPTVLRSGDRALQRHLSAGHASAGAGRARLRSHRTNRRAPKGRAEVPDAAEPRAGGSVSEVSRLVGRRAGADHGGRDGRRRSAPWLVDGSSGHATRRRPDR